MNARKMTPLMKTASSSGRPILLHYSLKGGHSAGVLQSRLVGTMQMRWRFFGQRQERSNCKRPTALIVCVQVTVPAFNLHPAISSILSEDIGQEDDSSVGSSCLSRQQRIRSFMLLVR